LVTGVSSVFGRTGAVVAQSGDYTTAQVTESGNLYYTDARARASLSFAAGSGAYNSTTGVITIPTNTNQLTNGASFITLASLSASAPLSYNNGTGAFSISQASGSTNGFLSSTDWNTFNNKQNALGYTPVPTTRTLTINGTSYDLSVDRSWTISAGLSGSGTTNYVAKFTGSTSIGNSLIYDNGTNVGIGTTSPALKLDVVSASQWDGIRVYNTTASQGADIRVGNDINNNLGFLRVGGSASGGNNQNTLMLGTGGGYTIHIAPNGTPAITALNGGNVGIGTTTPDFLLDVVRTTTGTVATFGIEGQTINPRLRIDADESNNTITLNPNYSGATSPSLVFKTQEIERMRITSTGNVSIGNTNNTYKLDVNNVGAGVANTRIYGNDQANVRLRLENAGAGGRTYEIVGGLAGANNSSFSIFDATASSTRLQIDSTGAATFSSSVTAGGNITSGSGTNLSLLSSGNVLFYNAAASAKYIQLADDLSTINAIGFSKSGSTSTTWFPTGNVGIGTTNPTTAKLSIQIANSGSNVGGLDITNGVNASFNVSLRTDITEITAGGTGNLVFSNTTERMRINSGGAVLINQTSSFHNALLTLNGKLHYSAVGGDIGGAIYSTWTQGSNGTPYYAGDLKFQYFTNKGSGYTLYDGMILDGAGRVGIGTTSPGRQLEVYSATTDTRIAITNTTSTSGSAKGFELLLAGSDAYAYNYVNGAMIFGTNATERMRITSSGDVNIGSTPSTGYKFNVRNASGNYISFWSPTIGGVATNGFLSHNGGGFNSQVSMGYNATVHVFNGEVTGGGTMQVAGDVNISGAFKINGTAIGTGGGGVSGSGTTNYLAKWTSGTSLSNSNILDSGSVIYMYTNTSASNVQFYYESSTWGTGTNHFRSSVFPLALDGSTIYFSNGGTQRMYLNSSGSRLFTGNGNLDTIGSTASGGVSIVRFDSTTGIGYDAETIHVFYTAGTEIARFNTGGEFLLGTTTDNGAYRLQVNSQIWATNATIATSDVRLKDNIQDISNALSVIMGLKPRTFTYKQDKGYNFGKFTNTGFIAQEIKESMTGLNYLDSIVLECGNYYGVAYEKFIPILTKGIQEQQVMIEQLKEEIKQLKGVN